MAISRGKNCTINRNGLLHHRLRRIFIPMQDVHRVFVILVFLIIDFLKNRKGKDLFIRY